MAIFLARSGRQAHIVPMPAVTTPSVLLWALLAACATALGAVPEWLRGRPSPAIMAWARALAAGLMLGVAHMLLAYGLDGHLVQGAVGALLGIGSVRLIHALTGTGELDLESDGTANTTGGNRVILAEVMHAAHEGVAIGAALLVSLPLGISMVVALGIHNVPEGMATIAALTGRGVRLRRATVLALAARLDQVLLASVTFAAGGAVPALLPWMVGFSSGALAYLVLVDLLPAAYRNAGRTSIAVVTMVALAMVVLLTGTPS